MSASWARRPAKQGALAWFDARPDGCDIAVVDLFLTSGSGLGVLEVMQAFAPRPHRVVLTNYATPHGDVVADGGTVSARRPIATGRAHLPGSSAAARLSISRSSKLPSRSISARAMPRHRLRSRSLAGTPMRS